MNSTESGKITWQSPSNIALVKYWGKVGTQIPSNPSISFTLSKCATITTLEYSKKENAGFSIFLDDKESLNFRPKIEHYLNRIEKIHPFVKNYQFKISTHNSFPHSSGIASSASGMSALSLCIQSLAETINSDSNFNRVASELSRLGSGSACRSIYGPLAVWGKHESYEGSNDEYAIPYTDVNTVYTTFRDTILLIDKGQKQVSSTVGHGLMRGHPFAKSRFEQANNNMKNIKECLHNGDLEQFIQIVETEALSLHAMMMTSNPYFLLMKPNTVAAIESVFNFRETTKIPLMFTLDAGANVHLLYPKNDEIKIKEFIDSELSSICENGMYINDEIGLGPNML